jgi:hypothetical protein
MDATRGGSLILDPEYSVEEITNRRHFITETAVELSPFSNGSRTLTANLMYGFDFL